MPESKKAESPISIITNGAPPKQFSEVNVDTARDNVFITRGALRSFLFNQRQMI